jgi:hypothetical protein
MKPQVKVPELAEAIAAHARAVLAGDSGAAEGHVAPAALEAYRRAMNEAMRQGPIVTRRRGWRAWARSTSPRCVSRARAAAR